MYIVSERDKERIKQQMENLKIEEVRFCEGIGPDEKKQGKRIKECLCRSEMPVIALIGHNHAGEDSEIHGYNKENNIKYMCIWNTNKEKKKDVRDKEKEENEKIKEFGMNEGIIENKWKA